MKKLTLKSLCGLCIAIIIGMGIFFIQPLTIYSAPQIKLYTHSDYSNSVPFAHKALFAQAGISCYRPEVETQSPIKNNPLRVLVWNLHKGMDQGWQAALTRYSQHANFVLLQEVTSEQNVQHQLSTLPYQVFSSPFAYKNIDSGVAILSQFMPNHYCSAAVVEPWLRIPKASLSAVYRLPNHQSLLVISVHFINFELEPEAYQAQMQQIAVQLQAHQGPVILAGDFNAWNAKRTVLMQKFAQQFGLSEVKFSPDQRERFWHYPLDYVFIRGLNVIQATTDKSSASDHNPLILELGW